MRNRIPNNTFSIRINGDHLVLFILFLLLLLTYASVIWLPYGLLDDYSFLYREIIGDNTTIKQTISAGRPLTGLLLRISFSNVSSIGGLSYIRTTTILGIIVLSWLFYRACEKKTWNKEQSASIAYILCTMPSLQVFASWSQYFVAPLAAIASGLAAHTMERVVDLGICRKNITLIIKPLLLVIIAITLYQPAAMVFWAFAAIFVFKPSSTITATIRRLSWYGLLLASGLAFDYIVWQLGMAFLYPISGDRANLTHDMVSKIKWFIEYPITNALNFGNIENVSAWIALLTGVLIIFGLLFYFRGSLVNRLGMLGMSMSLIPLSYTPNLLIAENWSSYRTQFGLTSLLVIYSFFALHGLWYNIPSINILKISKQYLIRISPKLLDPAAKKKTQLLSGNVKPHLLNIVFVTLATISGLLASRNVTAYFAYPQALEIAYIKSQLMNADLSHIDSIYVIRSKWSDSVAPIVHYDEYGFPSSTPSWHVDKMIYLLLRETDRKQSNIPITVIDPSQDIDRLKIPRHSLVIDMRQLKNFRRE